MAERLSNTKRIVGTALFAVLAFVISYFEFPVFSAASFLKLDFSNVIILICGFIYGPIAAVTSTAVKELLCFMSKSTTGGVGELANFILTTSFVLIPTLVYKKKKGYLTVIILLAFATVIETAAALIVNRFINFPLYMGAGAAAAFKQLYKYIIFFNLLKCVTISLITLVIYKKISKTAKQTGEFGSWGFTFSIIAAVIFLIGLMLSAIYYVNEAGNAVTTGRGFAVASLLLCAVAVGLSVVGIKKSDEEKKKNFAIAGLIEAIIFAIFSVVWIICVGFIF